MIKNQLINQLIFGSSDNTKADPNTGTPTSIHVESGRKTEFANKVILGLRSSIRSASSGKRLALFISSKIRPKYVVDQIITMTLTKNSNSKIFCVPEMDVAFFEVFGFSCQCLAILDDQNEIWNWIVEKSKQFPLPKSFGKFKSSLTERMDIEYTEKPKIVASEISQIDVTTLHLRKDISNERAFIPHGTILSRKNAENDFISLGETNLKIDNIRPKHQLISKIQRNEKPDAMTCSMLGNALSEKLSMKKKIIKTQNQKFHANKVNYLSLKVNRIQPNTEKVRNKNKKKNKKNKK